MRRYMEPIAIITLLATVAACAAINHKPKGYIICDDLNVTCPDNTANVVIGM